jgi:hypothetical protein
LFFPLVGEANEHVLARALQALSMIRDKVHEALDVDVIFEVHGQNVSHSDPSGAPTSRQLKTRLYED